MIFYKSTIDQLLMPCKAFMKLLGKVGEAIEDYQDVKKLATKLRTLRLGTLLKWAQTLGMQGGSIPSDYYCN